MIPRWFLVIILITVVFACAESSFADSDGYYCTSAGYLAYELREGLTPGIKGHVLRVVRYEAGRGIYSAGEVILKDFQVHSINCSAGRVEISGWDRVFIAYVVEISPPTGLRIAEHSDDSARQFDYRKDPPEPPNLARYARLETVKLDSSDADHSYDLVGTRTTTQVKGDESSPAWETHYHTELVQRDRKGTILQRVVLFDLSDIGQDCGD